MKLLNLKMKICFKCKVPKLKKGNFCKAAGNKDGLNSWCNFCHADHQRKKPDGRPVKTYPKQNYASKFKTCTKCKKRKSRSEKDFEVEKRNKGGLHSWCRDCAAEARRKVAHRYVLRQKGCTPEMYDQMAKDQGGLCKLCDRPPQKNRLNLDHCHETGKIRGLLCWSCNIALGYLQDSPALLRKAANYLEENR